MINPTFASFLLDHKRSGLDVYKSIVFDGFLIIFPIVKVRSTELRNIFAIFIVGIYITNYAGRSAVFQ